MSEYHPSAKQIAEQQERAVAAAVHHAAQTRMMEAKRIARVIAIARRSSKYMPHQGKRECARRLARA